LALLGSPRLTIDIDFVGDDVQLSELHQFIIALSKLDRGFIQPAVTGIATVSAVMILISQIRRAMSATHLRTWLRALLTS